MLGHNLALWKPTKQSSTPNPKYASLNAVDGIASVLLRRGSCAHTEAAVGSWWQVDLNGMYEIRELTITKVCLTIIVYLIQLPAVSVLRV